MDYEYARNHAKKKKILLNIESARRNKDVYKTSSEFSVDFVTPIRNAFAVRVLDCVIPKAEGNITPATNSFTFSAAVTGSPDPILLSTTIEPGTYSSSQLMTATNSLFMSNGVDVTVRIAPYDDLKFIFASASPFTFHMSRSSVRAAVGFGDPINRGSYYYNKYYT